MKRQNEKTDVPPYFVLSTQVDECISIQVDKFIKNVVLILYITKFPPKIDEVQQKNCGYRHQF